MKKVFLLATIIALSSVYAFADGKNYGPIKDKIVLAECGACHLAYQPGLLRSNSWEVIMAGLDDHFEVDASLDEETTRHIADYFAQYSKKSKNDLAPLRITELRWFIKEHRDEEVTKAARKKAGSMANCGAAGGCHSAKDAARGYYDD